MLFSKSTLSFGVSNSTSILDQSIGFSFAPWSQHLPPLLQTSTHVLNTPLTLASKLVIRTASHPAIVYAITRTPSCSITTTFTSHSPQNTFPINSIHAKFVLLPLNRSRPTLVTLSVSHPTSSYSHQIVFVDLEGSYISISPMWHR